MVIRGQGRTEGVCGCGECATSGGGTVPSGSGGGGGGGGTVATSGAMGAPSNGSKTAHSKVATGGGHANTQTSSKRSSSGADGDYQLVQHEVLYSLSAQYEVSEKGTRECSSVDLRSGLLLSQLVFFFWREVS
uniref:Uncharacterized protein n=1 Tax=Anopheles maculatus TaxID=74869 RepID=A0A182T560_9DIPT